jgi:hypothetical protein
MQSAEILVGRCGLFQLLNESAKPCLLWLCDDQELDADALRSAPANRGIFYLQRSRFSREVQEQRDLHSGKGRDHALNAAAFRREITNGAFVPKLVALDQYAWHADNKTTVFTSNHQHLPICSILYRGCCCQSLEILSKPFAFQFLHAQEFQPELKL